MAVFQISKIQLRRGLKDSLPQLASGEMGWAIDTQELFIGNGSVSEGAPAVGFTKILTDQDISTSLLETLQYTYNPDASDGSLQGKLAETVSSSDFGTKGNGVTDDKTAFQTAIDTLFNNQTTPSTGTGSDNVKARVTLEIPPGIYKLESFLIIPSYANIVGAGIDRTIFNYTGTESAFMTTPGEVTHDITISGITITASNNESSNLVLLDLNTTDSDFSNLKLQGGRNSSDLAVASKGIKISADSENLNFDNITVSNTCFGVHSLSANNVRYNNGNIHSVGYGLFLNNVLENQITNFKFKNITRNAIDIANNGTKNYINNCILSNVGNGEGGVNPIVSQIYFSAGNTCTNIKSDRPGTVGLVGSTATYFPEVAGTGEFSNGVFNKTLTDNILWNGVCRLPYNTGGEMGNTGIQPISYKILYSYVCPAYIRTGTLLFAARSTAEIGIADDYTSSGDFDQSALLDFSAEYDYNAILIKARNTSTTSANRTGTLSYSYTAIF